MVLYKVAILAMISNIVYGAPEISPYCVPQNSTGFPKKCWPKAEKWETLRKKLTGKLHSLSTNDYDECIRQGKNAFAIKKTGNGICMQYHDCSKAYCNTNQPWNVPAYSVEAHNDGDIKAALAFANEHNIAVTVKTSGHSYSGSSMGYGTLLIWMHKFEKQDEIMSLKDSCKTATTYPNVLRIGGGQVWKEAYDRVGSNFNLVGGGGLTVSAAGGWLMGGGLSALGRNLGMGIDNVLRFDVVLATGEKVSADKCKNSDLFWALRGGGGGTFGVVTTAYYKLHPVSKIVFSYFQVNDIGYWPHPTDITDSWLDFWVDKSPYLDQRWGGYWTLSSHMLYFQGTMDDAKTTFLDAFEKWQETIPSDKKWAITHSVSSHDSYYDQRGGKHAQTDETGSAEFNIASRLIPRDFVVNDPNGAKKMLKWMVRNGFYTFNYIVGGVMTKVGATETAVHPAMRKAIWQIETFDERLIRMLREEVKNTGAGYNHAAKREPNWEKTFWGSNLAELQRLKRKYDPKNRFNCWHCVGFQKVPIPDSFSVRTKGSFILCIFCLIIYLLSS